METHPHETTAARSEPTVARLATRTLAGVVFGYALVAIFQTWPLAFHLSTHLTGVPGSDTGAYVWNTWIFRRELLEFGHSPYWTTSVLALDAPTNLALHNYTEFADLLALPLQSVFSVVQAFNLVYLVNVTLSGFGMFVLVQRLTGRTAESWVAGLLFACAPFLVARGAQHFSLAAAAPLPFFVYWCDRVWTDGRRRDSAAAGATLAWAAYSDPYYAVYCVMMAVLFVLTRTVSLTEVSHTPVTRRVARALGLLIVVTAGLIAVVHVAAGGELAAGPIRLTMHTLYTPMLVLTVLVTARFALRLRVHLRREGRPPHIVGRAAIATLVATLLLVPELIAIGALIATGELVRAPVPWRSSAPGVDLAAFVIPNPNHPLSPDVVAAWLSAQPGRFDENVVSLSFVAIAVVALAWRTAGFRPDRFWIALTVGFAALAVGPFLTVAGIQTYVPTPWTFLRYVPVVGEARMPQRFAVVVFVGLAAIFGMALSSIGRRYPAQRMVVVVGTAVAVALELWPAPRRLVAADIPAVYRTIANDPRPVRVLDLPFGVRDGLSSLGDFSAASQFFQTAHGKDIVGGYLSRVDERTKANYRKVPVIEALFAFGENRLPTDEVLTAASASGPRFVTEARLGYVVVDTARTSEACVRFAVTALELIHLETAGAFELYGTKLVVDRQ